METNCKCKNRKCHVSKYPNQKRFILSVVMYKIIEGIPKLIGVFGTKTNSHNKKKCEVRDKVG